MQQFRDAMSRALFLANRASGAGDVPVGAVVLDPMGKVIGEGWNTREVHHDPTGHAEIMALREAGKRLKRWNLVGCTLVVTVEPCTMCAGAAMSARVDRVVFGAWEPKTGAAGSLRDVLRDSRMGHDIEVIPGVFAQEASVQMIAFFEECRRRSALKDRVPAVITPSMSQEDIALRSVTEALRAEAARTPRAWEGAGSGKARSLVRSDEELLAVEWDDAARRKYGDLPKVPPLGAPPRYGSLSAEDLRELERQRLGSSVIVPEPREEVSEEQDAVSEDFSIEIPVLSVVDPRRQVEPHQTPRQSAGLTQDAVPVRERSQQGVSAPGAISQDERFLALPQDIQDKLAAIASIRR